MTRGDLYMVSAPSGAGKTTLIRGMVTALGTTCPRFSVSHTTRPARPGEMNGRDYYFISDEEFDRMVEGREFLEWAALFGHQRSGTSVAEVLPALDRGEDVLLDIDVQGARQVWTRYPEAIGIFVLPPSFEVLQNRLVGRSRGRELGVPSRLTVSLSEVEAYSEYQYVIVNDDAARASRDLAAIVTAHRLRLERRRRELEERVDAFTAAWAARQHPPTES